MKRKKVDGRNVKSQSPSWVRASISFPPELCESLQEIAQQKKVPLAWFVHDAAEKYVAKEVKRKREGAAV